VDRRDFTITKVEPGPEDRWKARVNGIPVRMLSPLGGWITTEGREVLPGIAAALNERVRAERRRAARSSHESSDDA
jgi:hypothetical protein